jgi:hypothetical protein
MTLIVENGEGLADAESYISAEDASAYHEARGNTTWATMTEQEQEEALRRATDYMEQTYRQNWKGVRVYTMQALSWPRNYVEFEDTYYPNDEVPVEVQRASAQLACKPAAGELAEDLGPSVKREKVDVLEVEYDTIGPQYTRYRAVDNMLAHLLKNMGAAKKVIRV